MTSPTAIRSASANGASNVWEPFRPDVDGAWDERRVRHLVRRAAFGAGPELIETLVEMTPDDAIERLLTGTPDEATRQSESDALARTILASGDPKRLGAWWTYELITTTHPLRERMTLFWHGHFATGGDKVTDAEALYRQNRLLRDEALGNFRTMTHAIAKDPAMLVYLDSVTNRKAHPNENFARELMELFCLGEGNYSEADVQQLARCFTGWEIRQGKFRFNRYQHDDGEKSIFGRRSTFPDAEAVDWVLAHPAAPRFVASKLIRLFVTDAMPTDDELEPIAELLVEHDWNLLPAVRTILRSRRLLGDETIGTKVRSPVDLIIGLLRSFDGTANASRLADDLRRMGMGLFFPPNVKGWDGGRTWINAATLLERANGIGRLLQDDATRFDRRPVGEHLMARFGDDDDSLGKLAEVLLAVRPNDATLARLAAVGEGRSGAARAVARMHALAASPLAQLG
ncbi:MAG TPA: DUF1800 domain-containing protein [Pirellulaceae bacterium]|nr:DUF1800 domain-containing protein [Pirellulaceae bacterium]